MAEVHHLKDHRQTIQEALEDECAGLHDELAELLKKFKGQSRELAELRRDKQAEAEEDALWPLAVRLFTYWRRVSGHSRAKWTYERFSPFVRDLLHEPDGLERALRAISGCLSDAWRVERHLDLWEDILGSHKSLERCLAKCPKNWQPPPGYEKAPQPEG